MNDQSTRSRSADHQLEALSAVQPSLAVSLRTAHVSNFDNVSRFSGLLVAQAFAAPWSLWWRLVLRLGLHVVNSSVRQCLLVDILLFLVLEGNKGLQG